MDGSVPPPSSAPRDAAAPPRPSPSPPVAEQPVTSSPPSSLASPLRTVASPTPVAVSSSKNIAVSRRVTRLLDITINSSLCDLVSYMDEAVPTFLDPSASASAVAPTADHRPSAGNAVRATPGSAVLAKAASDNSPAAGAPTVANAAGLRVALEGCVADMHHDFLDKFRSVYSTFREAAAHVQELNKECTALESALGLRTSSGAVGGDAQTETSADAQSASPSLDDRSGVISAEKTEALVRHVNALQRELVAAQQRQKDIKEFKEKYNFGAEDQKLLEEGQVDSRYMDVLEKARVVHHKSRNLLLSREYQQNASAVMESTYNAIMRATEKISRFLLALSTAPAHGGGGGGSGGGRSKGVEDRGGIISSVSADVPEVSSLYLRCARVLREENVAQWEKVVEELARVRRASVLRRYFHLLTTGSATTSAGTYRAGASSSSSSSRHGADDVSGGANSLRPLEAELNNPVFFFSSLFAWLHQCIVEEDDFLALFFGSSTSAVTSPRDPAAASPTLLAGVPTEAALVPLSATSLTRAALLETVFDGVVKHVRTAFDGVLERFVKASAVLGHTMVTSGAAPQGLLEGDEAGRASTGGDKTQQQPEPAMEPMGPRGLTGGLQRLLFAATGRQMPRLGGGGGGWGSSGAVTALQRYASVSSRAQQENVMLTLMHGPLTGLQVCFQLLQLFAYYGASTFEPLLGPRASLTVLVMESANVELQRVLQQLVRFIALHLFDSVAGVVYRLPVLRRLSSAYEIVLEGHNAQAAAAARESPPRGTAAAEQTSATVTQPPPCRFVLDFLLKHYSTITTESLDESLAGSRVESTPPPSTFAPGLGSGAGATSDPQQQATAIELARSLQQLILPASPEVQASLRLLQRMLTDTARQQQMIAAVHEQQRKHAADDTDAAHSNGNAAPDSPKDAGEEEPAMHFTVVVQSLLGFPFIISKQPTVNGGLDEPCKAVLELNCFNALRDVLVQNAELLQQPSLARVSAEMDAGEGDAHAAGALARAGEPAERAAGSSSPLVAIVDSETARIEQTLCEHLTAAAIDHYLRSARLPPVEPTPASGASAEAESRLHAERQQSVRNALYWLYSLYSLIASNGALPALPLVSALRSTEEQQRLQRNVTHAVVEEYSRLYAEVERELREVAAGGAASGQPAAPRPSLLSEEETAAFVDMSPQKIKVLLSS